MVIAAYEEELVKSKQEGYICTYDDFEEDRYASLNSEQEESLEFSAGKHPGSTAKTAEPEAAHPEESSSEEFLSPEGDEGKKLRLDSPTPERPLAGDHNGARETLPERHSVSGGDGFGDGII